MSISLFIFWSKRDGRSILKSERLIMNLPVNEILLFSVDLSKRTFKSFSMPWKEIVPDTLTTFSESTVSLDLKTILGMLNAFKTL